MEQKIEKLELKIEELEKNNEILIYVMKAMGCINCKDKIFRYVDYKKIAHHMNEKCQAKSIPHIIDNHIWTEQSVKEAIKHRPYTGCYRVILDQTKYCNSCDEIISPYSNEYNRKKIFEHLFENDI